MQTMPRPLTTIEMSPLTFSIFFKQIVSRRENGIHKRLADSLGTVFGHRDSFTRILNTDAACLYRQVEKKNTKYNLLFLSLPIIIRSPFCTLHDWLSITKAILTVRLEFFQ